MKATSMSSMRAVANQQVGRLDVAVGQAGLPQPPDDSQAVVNDALVDLGLAQLGGAVEELGDQQVLPLRGELHEPVGPGSGEPGVAAEPQRVVLLLDQPPHGVERLLVLQAPIEQLPAQLVPAVGAQVAAGVQLGEQVAGRVALQGDPQRGRPGGAGQPERLDLLDLQTELLLQATPDRGPSGPADVQVGAAAPAVGDREDLVGGQQAEQDEWDRDPGGHADQHVGRRVGAQRDTAQCGQGHDPGGQ